MAGLHHDGRAGAPMIRLTKAGADAFAANVRPILMSLGDMSAQAKARELNARRVATASGGKWSATTVLRVQRRLEARG
jgi:hypothetical protein